MKSILTSASSLRCVSVRSAGDSPSLREEPNQDYARAPSQPRGMSCGCTPVPCSDSLLARVPTATSHNSTNIHGGYTNPAESVVWTGCTTQLNHTPHKGLLSPHATGCSTATASEEQQEWDTARGTVKSPDSTLELTENMLPLHVLLCNCASKACTRHLQKAEPSHF